MAGAGRGSLLPMSRLQTALHALSLMTCVALGATCWALWKNQASSRPVLAASPAPASVEDPVSVERLNRLEAEIALWKRRDPEPPSARPAHQAPIPGGPDKPERRDVPATPRTEPAGQAPSARTADLLAALEDPKVQARLQELIEQSAQKPYDMTEQIFKGRTLTKVQRDGMRDLLKESALKLDAVFVRAMREKLTSDQTRLYLEQERLQTDNKALALLGPELYRAYQEGIRPLREYTDLRANASRRSYVLHTDDKGVVAVPNMTGD